MPRHVVIIHGWSDTAKSFGRLAEHLQKNLRAVTHVFDLADWRSMDDDVTYADLAQAMQRAWLAHGLPQTPGSVDLVVHSTGALVAREWMTTFHAPESVPIKRFLMLAPANFGSPLAHKGQSFIGRAVKGWKHGFETGKQILRGLELASPYAWRLAERDVFVKPSQRWYGAGRILATVLIGNTGYRGIESIANEEGSDGTVRIAGANLNAQLLELDFERGSETPTARLRTSTGDIAFGVLDGENHSTIARKDKGFISPHTGELILQALRVDDAQFPQQARAPFAWQQQLAQLAPVSAEAGAGFQNTVVHLHDDFGQDITDYFFEFYRSLRNSDHRFEERFYREVIGKRVHPYGLNEAYRCFNLDVRALDRLRSDYAIDPLYLSVAASPEFRPNKQFVGYRSFGEGDLGRYAIPGAALDTHFEGGRTVLIRIGIPRWVDDSVFRLSRS